MRFTSWFAGAIVSCSCTLALAATSACGSSTTSSTSTTDGAADDASLLSDGAAAVDALAPSDAAGDAQPRSDADAANFGEGGASQDADAALGAAKRVFVSSVSYTGTIDPNSMLPDDVPDADKACDTLAVAAGLGGPWRAYVREPEQPRRRGSDRVDDRGVGGVRVAHYR